MPKPIAPYIVGRTTELQMLSEVVHGTIPCSIVNVYGPGGIGKTTVCHKLGEWCTAARVPWAVVAGDDPVLTAPDKVLFRFRMGLGAGLEEAYDESAFSDFDRKFADYVMVRQILDRSGGADRLFDSAGNPNAQLLIEELRAGSATAVRSPSDYVIARGQLRRNLVDSFNEEELRTLCFDAGVDYEVLIGQGKLSKSREIVAYFEHSGRLDELVEICRRLRPNVLWNEPSKLERGGESAAADQLLARYFRHRDSLERYVNGVDAWLTASFADSVRNLLGPCCPTFVLALDAYEAMSALDAWVCETLMRLLPEQAKVVIFGRDRVGRVNPDWQQYEGDGFRYHELDELSADEAKDYLRYHGLTDPVTLDRIYEFTGGYPLCLVLAVDLARDLGWDGVRGFEDPANRDRVASQLLDRILRQEKVSEVQEFLEKGVVARWFDPGAVSYILNLSPERGREIYDKIGKFSFVARHPNGLKFHDRVRELLVERLKFLDGGQTYRQLAGRWSQYLRGRASLGEDREVL